jgi:23S rRNA (adenine2503-C2)-methyltransferase
MEKDLKNKTIDELEQIVTALGGQKYQAKYIFSFIHSKNNNDINAITPLSLVFRKQLIENGFYISALKISRKLIDPADGTIKYLFELGDGLAVESVLLFEDDRTTLCASTQVGCALGCQFCATGAIGFTRNLSAAEIADQVNTACKDGYDVTNVVFMGMGEPLINYENVIKAVKILNDKNGKRLGIRHITISTCGIIEGIRKLAGEKIQPRLAISLNATNDELRRKLMPIAKKYPLQKLLDALKSYQYATGQRFTFEYVLIGGINDSDAEAKALAGIAKKFLCNVNLIEFNPHSNSLFKTSSRIKSFSQILTNAGVKNVIRLKKGYHIKAACGQLGADLLSG